MERLASTLQLPSASPGIPLFGIAIAVAFGAIAAATTDESLSRAVYRTLETVPWLSIPMGIAAIATRSLLGLGTAHGLVRHWWVVAKIIIAVAVVVTDALIVAAVAHDAAITGQAQPPSTAAQSPTSWCWRPRRSYRSSSHVAARRGRGEGRDEAAEPNRCISNYLTRVGVVRHPQVGACKGMRRRSTSAAAMLGIRLRRSTAALLWTSRQVHGH